MKNHKYLLFLFIIAMISNGCKKDCHDASNPDCENYNPCFGKKPVTAEILLEQQMIWTNQNDFYHEDSVFWKFCIRFSCPDKSARKYTWILGSETLNGSSFVRCFEKQPYGEYEVKLIIEKTPDLTCFPDDDGIDTIVKKFKIVNVCDLLTEGTFRGRWSFDPSKEFDFSIKLYDENKDVISCDESKATRLLITNFLNVIFKANLERWYISNTYFKSGFGKNVGERQGNYLFEMKVNPFNLECEVNLWDEIYEGAGVFTKIYKGRFKGIKID